MTSPDAMGRILTPSAQLCEFGIEKIRMDSDVCVVDIVTADDAFEI